MLSDHIEVKDLDPAPVELRVSQYLEEAQAVEIKDDDDYQYAGALLTQEKTLFRFVEDFYKPTKDAMNLAKAELMKNIKAHIEPLGKAEFILKEKRRIWREEQEKIRLKEQKKLLEKLKKEEEERRLEEAIETGDETVLEEPIVVAPPPIQAMPKEKGHSYSDLWHGEVVDATKVPREYLMPDEKKIDRMAKATKGTVQIAGVKIWKEQIESVRTR